MSEYRLNIALQEIDKAREVCLINESMQNPVITANAYKSAFDFYKLKYLGENENLIINEELTEKMKNINKNDLEESFQRFNIYDEERFRYTYVMKFYLSVDLPPFWQKHNKINNTKDFYYSIKFDIISEIHPVDYFILHVIDHIRKTEKYNKDLKQNDCSVKSTEILEKLEGNFLSSIINVKPTQESNQDENDLQLYKDHGNSLKQLKQSVILKFY
jgi:hypothetical protein